MASDAILLDTEKGNKYNIIKSKTTLNDKMHIYTVLFFKAVL